MQKLRLNAKDRAAIDNEWEGRKNRVLGRMRNLLMGPRYEGY